MYIKYLFIFFAFSFAVMLIIYKCFLQKIKKKEKATEYTAILATALLFYVLNSIIFSFYISGLTNKIIILLLGLSPFIIGKFATYQKESFYSFIQILCVIINLVVVYAA